MYTHAVVHVLSLYAYATNMVTSAHVCVTVSQNIRAIHCCSDITLVFSQSKRAKITSAAVCKCGSLIDGECFQALIARAIDDCSFSGYPLMRN